MGKAFEPTLGLLAHHHGEIGIRHVVGEIGRLYYDGVSAELGLRVEVGIKLLDADADWFEGR